MIFIESKVFEKLRARYLDEGWISSTFHADFLTPVPRTRIGRLTCYIPGGNRGGPNDKTCGTGALYRWTTQAGHKRAGWDIPGSSNSYSLSEAFNPGRPKMSTVPQLSLWNMSLWICPQKIEGWRV